MDDFSELEDRITAALDRIGLGLEALAKPVPVTEPEVDMEAVEQLRGELEDEKTANAQLEERVRAIREKQESTVANLTGEVDRLRELLKAEEASVARMKRVNGDLRANNDALRTAISENVAEPHLVNKSMMAELEALRATQAADRTELDAVMGELGVLLVEAEAGEEARAGDEETRDA